MSPFPFLGTALSLRRTQERGRSGRPESQRNQHGIGFQRRWRRMGSKGLASDGQSAFNLEERRS